MTEPNSSCRQLARACLFGLMLLGLSVFSSLASTEGSVSQPADVRSAVSAPSASTASEFLPSFSSAPSPDFTPGFPGKKGPTFMPEKHGFAPRSFLREHQLEGKNLFTVSAVPASPDTVTRKILALLVQFTDQPLLHERLFIERHLFFLTQYYSIVSSGKLKLEPLASDSVFMMPQLMTEYGKDDDLGKRLVELAKDAIHAADSLIDFTIYDDFVIIHAGLGQEADVFGDSPELIWSATLGPAEFEYYLPDSTGHVGIATNDTLPDGQVKYIDKIAVLPEDESQDGFLFSPLGVYAHEYGHSLGLPDLYDTNPVDATKSQGIGNWGLMGTGLWNGGGLVPAEPCAWSKAILGWRPVRIVTHCDACELPYSEGVDPSGELVLVPIGGREYFLLENRLQDPNGNHHFDFDDVDHDDSLDVYIDSYAGAEFDYALPGFGTGSGLLIWHIDEQQIEAWMPYNLVNGDRFHKGVDLEEADGMEDLDAPFFSIESYGSPYDSFREGNNSSFTPSTVPNSDGSYGGKSWVTIDSIGAPGQLMSFAAEIGKRANNWPFSALAAFGSNHPNAADLDGDGTPELLACDIAGNLYVREGDDTGYLGSGAGPLKALGEEVLSSPVIGDIDGDGLDEIVVVAASGTVYAWNAEDASEVMDGDNDPLTEGVLANVGIVGHTEPVLEVGSVGARKTLFFGSSLRDTTLESIPPQDSLYTFYALYLTPDSVQTSTWLFPQPAYRAPIFGDLDGNGTREILLSTGAGSGEGRLNLIEFSHETILRRPCNCELSGEQVEFVELVAGDLDRDRKVEVAGADTKGRLHLMHVSSETMQLSELPGWPLNLVDRDSLDLVGEDTAKTVAISIGEIDDDGRLEVLATFASRAYAVNYNGTVLRNWPPLLQVRNFSFGKPHGPLCADVTADNRADFVGTLSDGRIASVLSDATIPSGWPVMAGSSYGASPILADINGDGLTELVCLRDVGVQNFALTAGTGAGVTGRSGSSTAVDAGGVVSAASAQAPPSPLSGQIDALELGVPFEPSLAFWPSYRRDKAHSGFVPDSVSLPDAPAQIVRGLIPMPNPARGESVTLHYTLSENVDRVRIEIYDLAGRRVYSAEPAAFASSDNWCTVSLAPFAPGVYLCSVEATRSNGTSERAFAKFAVLR